MSFDHIMETACGQTITILYIPLYYNLKLEGLSSKTTLVLSNTRELNRVPSTK